MAQRPAKPKRTKIASGAGRPPRTLAKLLGHSNTRVTMQFYNRVTDANERAAAAAMGHLLAPLTSKDAV